MVKSMAEAGDLSCKGFDVCSDSIHGCGMTVDIEENKQDESLEEEIRLWDSFNCTEDPPRSSSMAEKHHYELILCAVKLILYLVLFLVILGGSVVAKMSAIFATSQLQPGRSVPFCEKDSSGQTLSELFRYEVTLPDEARIPWIWSIVFAFSLPEALDILRCLWNLFFVEFTLPKPRYFALLTGLEVLQVIGVALLFLVCLPDLDVLQAASALTCVCFVPGILGLFSRKKCNENKQKFILYAIGDILSCVAQIGGIIHFTCILYNTKNAFAPWLLPTSLALTSLRWWGNYVSTDSSFGFVKNLAKARRYLQPHRPTLIGYTAALRIITFLLSGLLIALWKGITSKEFFDGFWMKEYKYIVTLVNKSWVEDTSELTSVELQKFIDGNRWEPFYVFLINGVAGICVYSFSKFACKTLMQGFGFALPINLALPMTVSCIWILFALRKFNVCFVHTDRSSFNYIFYFVPEEKNYASKWYAWLWLVWLGSQIWISVHIWSTRNERLATTNRIFAIWSYDSFLLDQSMALSRWREEPDDDFDLEKYEDIEEPIKSISNLKFVKKEDHITKMYACATMWHESVKEMTDFLNSILRLDRDQCISRILQRHYRIISPDYYELEVHVFFDDAFECDHGCKVRCQHDENKTQVNNFVVNFITIVEKCITARKLCPSPPIKYPTPYGGRLLWILPEKTKMYVHLKDKNRIRTKKRWSQVMYMYYLLGFRLMQLPIEEERKEVIARNTYILTLDGDIDFTPSAVRILLDRMKVNKDLGSVCGRIHPLGKGPMVWFQKFEYAIGHWLQKSTEHIVGCVLCSPGCFALFRAQALMDYNVMRKYATVSQEPRHFIQYDQGEDRWLCTLILQRGYKVEYLAASDAFTHVPETFNEFFIQRRRWIPSTMANILDLLETAKETKKNNRDFSWVYIFYQWLLMGSSIVGPGTIFLMLVGAFVSAFRIGNGQSFVCNLVPIFIFCLICYFCTEDTQLFFAGIITAIYGLVMIVVLVGILIQITEDGWLAPSTLLFLTVVIEVVITGLLHPLEWTCLIYGIIYYITVPSMYMLLIIFSLFNMNNVSWGTRDTARPISNKPIKEQQDASQNDQPNKVTTQSTKKKKGAVKFFISRLFKFAQCAQEQPSRSEDQLQGINSMFSRIENRINEIESLRSVHGCSSPDQARRPYGWCNEPRATSVIGICQQFLQQSEKTENLTSSNDADSDMDEMDSIKGYPADDSGNFLVSPNWMHGQKLGKSKADFLKRDEEIFWKQFISIYLDPIDKDEKQKAEIAMQITNLRDNYIFKFFMINSLFVVIIFLMQLHKDVLYLPWPLGVKYNITYTSNANEIKVTKEYLRLEPIGCLFILGFISILLVQFVAMLFHRFETFSHIMAKVNLNWYYCDMANDLSEEAIIDQLAEKITKELLSQVDQDRKFDQNSNLPPSKRMTVHQSLTGNERRHLLTETLSFTLEKILEESRQIDTDMSQTALRILEKRRTAILAEEELRQSHGQNSNMVYSYETSNNFGSEILIQKQPKNQCNTYQNPSFLFGEHNNKEGTRILAKKKSTECTRAPLN